MGEGGPGSLSGPWPRPPLLSVPLTRCPRMVVTGVPSEAGFPHFHTRLLLEELIERQGGVEGFGRRLLCEKIHTRERNPLSCNGGLTASRICATLFPDAMRWFRTDTHMLEQRVSLLESKLAKIEVQGTAQTVAMAEIAATVERNLKRTLQAERRSGAVEPTNNSPFSHMDPVSRRIWERRRGRRGALGSSEPGEAVSGR